MRYEGEGTMRQGGEEGAGKGRTLIFRGQERKT